MRVIYIALFFLFASFHPVKEENPFIVILGIAQDAGYPQIGCEKECCKKVYAGKAKKQMVSSIAIVDPVSKEKWIIDATPDLPEQLQLLNSYLPGELSGILLTHAHIGHYTGLMYLGREAMNTNKVPVYAMPRMTEFLKTNGPWSQLQTLNNIDIKKMEADSLIYLNKRIGIMPVMVPHRDEFSETVGFLISAGKTKVWYIPDIDKWNKWGYELKSMNFTYAIVDGTFYKEYELPGRNMNEIPHPFVVETMRLFEHSETGNKARIWFTHFNHTNPLINHQSKESKEVRVNGFNVVKQEQIFRLN